MTTIETKCEGETRPEALRFFAALTAFRKAKECEDQTGTEAATRARAEASEAAYLVPSHDTVDLRHKLDLFQEEELDGMDGRHDVALRAIFGDVRRLTPKLGYHPVDTSALENLYYDLDDVMDIASALSDCDELEAHIRGSLNLIARELGRIYSALYNTTFPDTEPQPEAAQ